jgi:hypothetical protein
VRIPNPRLVRLGGLTRGAIVEQGDGELLIPAVLQPSIMLPSPITRVLGAGLTFQDSFITNFANAVTGAQAGATNVIATLSKGLWSIRWSMDAMFSGTTAASAGTFLNVVDQVAATMPLKALRHISGRQIGDNGELVLLLQEDGWHFDSVLGVTIAGDSLGLDISIYGARLM